MCASSRDRKREVCPDFGAARRPQSADRRKLNFTQQRKAISTRPCRIFRGFQLARRQRLQFPTLERGRCLSNFIDYIPHLRKSVLARLAFPCSLYFIRLRGKSSSDCARLHFSIIIAVNGDSMCRYRHRYSVSSRQGSLSKAMHLKRGTRGARVTARKYKVPSNKTKYGK